MHTVNTQNEKKKIIKKTETAKSVDFSFFRQQIGKRVIETYRSVLRQTHRERKLWARRKSGRTSQLGLGVIISKMYRIEFIFF